MEVQLNVVGNQAVILKSQVHRGKKHGCHQKWRYGRSRETGLQDRKVLETFVWNIEQCNASHSDCRLWLQQSMLLHLTVRNV